MPYSSHSAQSNGFLQTAGKGAAPTAHRGVSVRRDVFLARLRQGLLESVKGYFSFLRPVALDGKKAAWR